MEKLISFVLIASLGLSLSACAVTAKEKGIRVKCPACGYEFDAPAKD